MKPIKWITSLLIFASLFLFSCSAADGLPYTLTFSFVDGEENLSLTLTGAPIDDRRFPDAPLRENYIFTGWYKDAELTKPFDPELCEGVSRTLYAGWELDYESISRACAESLLTSNITLTTTHYNTNFFGQLTDSLSTSGSGVIIAEDETQYYFLTNNHCVEKNQSFSYTKYVLTDAYGDTYTATLAASEASYDLALLSFAKGNNLLTAASLAEENPNEWDAVFSIGAPKGVRGALTFGKVITYRTVEFSNNAEIGSSVTFDTVAHTAYVTNGSSGGGLFDASLCLAGINYATSSSEEGEFIAGFAIPISRVWEFLEAAGYRTLLFPVDNS